MQRKMKTVTTGAWSWEGSTVAEAKQNRDRAIQQAFAEEPTDTQPILIPYTDGQGTPLLGLAYRTPTGHWDYQGACDPANLDHKGEMKACIGPWGYENLKTRRDAEILLRRHIASLAHNSARPETEDYARSLLHPDDREGREAFEQNRKFQIKYLELKNSGHNYTSEQMHDLACQAMHQP